MEFIILITKCQATGWAEFLFLVQGKILVCAVSGVGLLFLGMLIFCGELGKMGWEDIVSLQIIRGHSKRQLRFFISQTHFGLPEYIFLDKVPGVLFSVESQHRLGWPHGLQPRPAFSLQVEFASQVLGCRATGALSFIFSPPRQQGALERFEEWHTLT